MLKYKLHKIQKMVQTPKQADNSVMTMALFHQNFGSILSLLKECENVKLVPLRYACCIMSNWMNLNLQHIFIYSFYHGLYRSALVPYNEQQVQEYLRSKGIPIMQYEVAPSKSGKKAGKAKKVIENKDYSADDEELEPAAVKKGKQIASCSLDVT